MHLVHQVWDWLGSHWASIFATAAFVRGWMNNRKIRDVNVQLNGRLTELIAAEKALSRSQGVDSVREDNGGCKYPS